jgi:hypothetical protein
MEDVVTSSWSLTRHITLDNGVRGGVALFL